MIMDGPRFVIGLGVQANCIRARETLDAVRALGLIVELLRPSSPAVRVHGRGVDILAMELRYIRPDDLRPGQW